MKLDHTFRVKNNLSPQLEKKLHSAKLIITPVSYCAKKQTEIIQVHSTAFKWFWLKLTPTQTKFTKVRHR